MKFVLFFCGVLSACATTQPPVDNDPQHMAASSSSAPTRGPIGYRPEMCPKGTRHWCDDAYDRASCQCVDNNTADRALRALGFSRKMDWN